jgi:protein ImuB
MEPIATPEAFAQVIGDLVADVVGQLTCIGKGARRLDCYFHRVDGHNQAIRIGTATASRDAGHLAKLLCAKIETVEPGLGIEAMTLVTPLADALAAQQDEALESPRRGPNLASLVDALANRFGPRSLHRAAPHASSMPERSITTMPALAKNSGAQWDDDLLAPPACWIDPSQSTWSPCCQTIPSPLRVASKALSGDPRRWSERLHGEWWRESGNEADKALIVGIIIRSRPRQAVGTGCSGSVTA